jgi:polar amino acid transport system permease protein
MSWDWLPEYSGLLLQGLWLTIFLLVTSCVFGMLLAIPIGLVQVTGPWPLAWLAKGFCTVIRGTPLLIQIWLLYYGLGSLFPSIPWIRESFMWPVLREGIFYGVLALTLSFAGYEGEIMRGGFMSVPRGELEAARSFGMSPFTILRRVWFPRAFRLVLPTLGGEVIGQLKSTPLVATITIMEIFGVSSKIRQDTYRVYEPLIFVAAVYFCLTFVITRIFLWIERQVPQKR